MTESAAKNGQECDSCLRRTRTALSAAGWEYGKFESSPTRRAFKVAGSGTDGLVIVTGIYVLELAAIISYFTGRLRGR